MKTFKKSLCVLLSVLMLTAALSITTVNAAVAATGIKLNTGTLTITAGNKYTLKATITPSNATNKTVYWKSSNTAVVAMGAGGVVNAKKAGTATVTAKTNNGKTATCKVTVKSKVAATGIKMSTGTLTITSGNKYTLSAAISPSNASNKTVYWSSSNTSVVSMGAGGVVNAKNEGTATVTAKTSNGKAATCKVTVVSKGDSWNTARSYSTGTTAHGKITESQSKVYYKYKLSSPGRINIHANAYMASTSYCIYDANHSKIKSWISVWDTTTKVATMDKTIDLTSGTYYFVVTKYLCLGNYDFNLGFTSANETFPESQTTLYNSFEKAKGVSMNTTYKGQIAENDEVDYFKFTVSSTGLVKLDATSYMPSVTYYIYDSGNNKLAIWPSVWDSVTKVATLSKTHLLTAGTYYLVVDKTVGSTGNYNFKLS